MIFVTVGTHEQQFNRLIEYVDKLVQKKVVTEEVIIQTGYSTYKPNYCKWEHFFSYQEMKKNVSDARIVITHGGPSSFIMPLQIGKTPLVVPRIKEFDEHVNNHQMEFCKAVEKRMGTIIVIEDIDDLKNAIKEYDNIISSTGKKVRSNNLNFCIQFEKIVHDILESK